MTCLFPKCVAAGKCQGHAPATDTKAHLAKIVGASYPGAGRYQAPDLGAGRL